MSAETHRDDAQTWAGFQLLTVFGLGHMRPASGTWGSLPPVLLAGALVAIGAGAPVWYALLTGMLLLFAGACVVLGDHAEARWGKDPSNVVADEVAGMCVTLLLAPPALMQDPVRAPIALLAAFLLFRCFDIFKEIAPPARGIQRVRGGWGVLLDDLISGVYAAGALWLISGLLILMRS